MNLGKYDRRHGLYFRSLQLTEKRSTPLNKAVMFESSDKKASSKLTKKLAASGPMNLNAENPAE
ncbi:hypothetical protein KXD40_006607 [Peronospora effusa]|nr:hypothetical protein KXD40_006607 [Peronospora effusa]